MSLDSKRAEELALEFAKKREPALTDFEVISAELVWLVRGLAKDKTDQSKHTFAIGVGLRGKIVAYEFR